MPVIAILAVVAVLLLIAMFAFPDVARDVTNFVRERREAEARAARMLGEMLTPHELAQLDGRGFLAIPSPNRPGRVYHVPRHQGLVSVYERGVLAERLCVGAINWIPDADTVLLHKLMIEGNEEEYLRMANHFLPRPYSYPL
ncbi:MAG: hypothetical protein ACYC3S_06780 [Chloroflexota bacterium]